VAHSISAKKRVRQNIKRRARNRHHKELIKDQVKAFTTALTAGDVKQAEEELRKTTQKLDRVAVTGGLHRNTASRKRSRLTKRLNALRAAGGKGTKAA
jgi:small subunit ribosomal protein S20